MIEHPATKDGIETLKSRGVGVIESVDKFLACQDKGKGAMAEPETIFWHIAKSLLKEPTFASKNCIVTGGGTKEAIDEVRCISNHSSGKMAESLALGLFLKGANVTLVSSANAHLPHLPFKHINYQSSENLRKILHSLKPTHQILYMAAAVSDYLVANPSKGKCKKSKLGPKWQIELIQNQDILKEMVAQGFQCIGFKAETDTKSARKNAQEMLLKKDLHAVCLNVLDKDCHFGSEDTKMDIFVSNSWVSLPLQSKLNAAFSIIDLTL
jgi:phosphopantothenoylcysteine decarboxylase/phosphopantothenate--cysteine ligase